MSTNIGPAQDEGGLRAPTALGFWGKAWWWFHFLILVNLARLRFIILLATIGLVIIHWDWLVATFDKWTRPAAAAHAASDYEYFCPMHPAVIRENPKEKCPICFMPLSKRKIGEKKDVALPPGIVNRVQLSPYKVVLAGIQTWKVNYVPLVKEITTVGYVDFNERGMKQVAARVKGRIDKLIVNETGRMVDAGDALASLYSPDLVVTMQNLLDAHKSGNAELKKIAWDRLVLWGISTDQMEQMLKTGKANTHLIIRSPIHGHVYKKYVQEGQYVEEGSPLYDLADLSSVWVQGQIYEDDMAFLPPQSTFHDSHKPPKDLPEATITTRDNAAETFAGKLTFVFPHLDQKSRTVTIRFELDNPEHKLRPGTTATVKLKMLPRRLELLTRTWQADWAKRVAAENAVQSIVSPLQPALGLGLSSLERAAITHVLLQQGFVLAVPDDAVIDTGSQKIVYREIGPAEYEGVLVELGPRMVGPDEGSYYPVLRGLQAGDSIVTAGSFLVDAETRLNPAAGSIYFAGSSGAKGGQAGVSHVKPSTPVDEEATVKAAFAKLENETDRRLAAAQYFCPVIEGSRLGLMGPPIKIMVQGQPVFLCCETCRTPALANPKKTLDEVQRLKKAKKGASH